MPTWISKGGKWFPAKEFAVNPNFTIEDQSAGRKPVYEGPDRAAQEILEQEGVEYLGQDFRMNPDLIRQSRELGFKSVDEYLSVMHGVETKKIEEEAEKKAEVVNQHKNPSRKKSIKEVAGGEDRSGKGQHRYGDFGDPSDVPNQALKQRA